MCYSGTSTCGTSRGLRGRIFPLDTVDGRHLMLHPKRPVKVSKSLFVGFSIFLLGHTFLVCRIRLTLVMNDMQNMANVLGMHFKMYLKARVDFTLRHDVPCSADLEMVSKCCFIYLLDYVT